MEGLYRFSLGVFVTITGLGIKTDICVEFGISPVIVGIRVGGGVEI